jgi:glycosyltransferase involved in cell wall biosynthesis
VDNDKDRSAEETVRNFKLQTEVETNYDCEPEQNISLARNRAIRNARGNLIAFLDDDEYPGNDWLIQLYQALNRYKADGVLGPVLPEFPPGAPGWLRQGKFFERRRLATGSIISERDARTGNVLFRRTLFRDGELWFDPAYGRTGGEDSDFFRRQSRLGRVFVWCDEAVVHETVPSGRWRLLFHMKKSFRIGTLTGEEVRRGELPSEGLLTRNLLLLGMLALLAPLMLVAKKHVRARIFVKMAYCAGYLFGFCGIGATPTREYS